MDNNIDQLIYQALFSSNDSDKKSARTAIRQLAKTQGVQLSSIHDLYMAFGNNQVTGFTVPAINIRALTYDTARTIFSIMKEKKVGPVLFEIARSEIGYTKQEPDEYAVSILAAAIKENYTGPVCIQGDHYQFAVKKYAVNPTEETEKIKKLIKDSIDAGFYNIDIDASTLVDLNKPDLNDQQQLNYQLTSEMTKYIRSLEPAGVTISVGGEIGHIGGKNSTVDEFEAFMNGYLKEVPTKGISKVSVQTGTSHGGIPLPDGTIAKVSLDFDVLKTIGESARNKYKIGGPVQHGASTLPNELFDRFPISKTLEIHLATGFQNIIYDNLPTSLKEKIYQWLKDNCADERKEGQTEEQFIYKTRKKGFGPFKLELHQMTEIEKQPIVASLKKQFEFLFEKLNVINTQDIVNKYFKV